jgi:hypothetical protein
LIYQQLEAHYDNILVEAGLVEGFLATSPSAEDASRGLIRIIYKPEALTCCRLGMDDKVPLDEGGLHIIHGEFPKPHFNCK